MGIFFQKLPVVILMLTSGISLKVVSQELTHAMPYGSKQELREFIEREMVYPAGELKRGIEGTVVISGLITRNATVANVQVIKSVSPAIDTESLRIFKLLLWEPAKSFGVPADEKVEMEFDFSVKRYEKIVKKRGYNIPALPYPVVDSSGKIYSYRTLEIQPKPVFIDKDMTMQKFMAKNFTYPENALKQNISGQVSLKFVVEPTGHISNLRVEKHLGAGCSEEALRLVKLMTWTPGIYNGTAVRTMMNLSLLFSLKSGTGYDVQSAQPGFSLQ